MCWTCGVSPQKFARHIVKVRRSREALERIVRHGIFVRVCAYGGTNNTEGISEIGKNETQRVQPHAREGKSPSSRPRSVSPARVSRARALSWYGLPTEPATSDKVDIDEGRTSTESHATLNHALRYRLASRDHVPCKDDTRNAYTHRATRAVVLSFRQ